jgi:hypothetical protein
MRLPILLLRYRYAHSPRYLTPSPLRPDGPAVSFADFGESEPPAAVLPALVAAGRSPFFISTAAFEFESFFGFILTQLRSVGTCLQSTGPPPALPGTSGACAGIDDAAIAAADTADNNAVDMAHR